MAQLPESPTLHDLQWYVAEVVTGFSIDDVEYDQTDKRCAGVRRLKRGPSVRSVTSLFDGARHRLLQRHCLPLGPGLAEGLLAQSGASGQDTLLVGP